MNPISSVIIPILTSDGTPDSGFGKIGQYCYDGTNHLMYGPKTVSGWGTGYPVGGGIDDGTATGQLLYWDNDNVKWASSANISYDEMNARLNINSYPSPVARLSVLGANNTTGELTTTIAQFRNNLNSESPIFTISATTSSTAAAKIIALRATAVGGMLIDANPLYVGANNADNSRLIIVGNIRAQNSAHFSLPGQALKVSAGSATLPASYAGGTLYLDAGSGISGVVAVGTINANAKMGIGTSAPSELLSVKGSQSFIITTTGTPTERDVYKIVPSLPTTTDASRTGQIDEIIYSYAGNKTFRRTFYDGTNATTKLGDIAGGNYIEIENDGTPVLVGTAVVYEDLNFDPDASGGPAATLPDYVTINNVIHREFTSANNQLCGSSQEIPHETKISGTNTYYPHYHCFLKSGESAGTTGVTFTLYWELRQSTGTTSGSVALTATSAELTANPHKFTVNDATGFTGSTELGAQLAMTLSRTGGDAGDVIVTTYGIHYPIDTMGSRDVTSK